MENELVDDSLVVSCCVPEPLCHRLSVIVVTVTQ